MATAISWTVFVVGTGGMVVTVGYGFYKAWKFVREEEV